MRIVVAVARKEYSTSFENLYTDALKINVDLCTHKHKNHLQRIRFSEETV
jgi:hypothetical protein